MISLLLLTLAGVGYLVAPAALFQLRSESATGMFAFWQNSVESFAVPFSLLLLSFSKGKFIRLATIVWCFWLVISTVVVFWSLPQYAPEVNQFGNLFMVAVLIFASTTTISTSMTFYVPLKSPEEKEEKPSSDKVGVGQIPTNDPTPE